MAKVFILPTTDKTFRTKKAFKAYLEEIKIAIINNGLTSEMKDDLFDFIEFYHDDGEIILEEFEFVESEFEVKKAPFYSVFVYKTEC